MRSLLRQLSPLICFFFNEPATTEIYTLSLHDALPIYSPRTRENGIARRVAGTAYDDSSTARARSRSDLQAPRSAPAVRMRSEEHTSELQSRGHLVCRLLLEKKKKKHYNYISKVRQSHQ